MSLYQLKIAGPRTSSPAGKPDRRRVLVIDGPEMAGLHLTAPTDLMIHTQIRHLTRGLLETVKPELVAAPLITPEWDILDLAEALHDSGYRGPLVVRSLPLPRADLVLGEIQALFPGISLALVEAEG